MMLSKMKPKKCKVCNSEYTPQKYSSCKTKCEECIFVEHKQKLCIYAKKQSEKPKKVQCGSAPKIDKQWIALSKFIKKRDAGLPCISCGKFMQEYEIQAGHYIARGKSIKLKYEPRNIHAQCWNCNNNHQIQQQMQEGFRNGLIIRYGMKEVEWLENNK
jgi:ribosomal 50S subunit-recycling heat shock protein